MTAALASLLAVLLLYYCAACDGGASAGSRSVSLSAGLPAAALPTPSVSEMPLKPGTDTRGTTPSNPTCLPPLKVAPKTLATMWPKYLGTRVTFACRAVRRVDLVRSVVVADGAKFIVTGPPNVTPCADRSSTFTVVGASAIALAGRVVLPELLLVDEGECTQ